MVYLRFSILQNISAFFTDFLQCLAYFEKKCKIELPFAFPTWRFILTSPSLEVLYSTCLSLLFYFYCTLFIHFTVSFHLSLPFCLLYQLIPVFSPSPLIQSHQMWTLDWWPLMFQSHLLFSVHLTEWLVIWRIVF